MRKDRIILNVFLALTLTLALIWVMPLIFAVFNSFKSYEEIFGNFFALPSRIDFSIYKETWEILEMSEKFLNTMFYTATVTFICAVLTPMAAYKLGRVNNKTSIFLSILFVLPIMVPFTTYCAPLSMLLGRIGIMNTRLGYILVNIGLNTSFCVYVVRGFVTTVPKDVEECAIVDGASHTQMFFWIVYPLLIPAISTVCIVTAVNVWCDMIVCKIVASASESMLNIQTKLYSRFSSTSSDWTHAFPAIVISFIPTIVFFIAMQDKVVEGVAAGAVKG